MAGISGAALSLPKMCEKRRSILVRVKKLQWILLLCFCFPAPQLRAQGSSQAAYPAPIPLWNGAAPGAMGNGWADTPRIYPFLPASRSTDAAILVIPGGGYQMVAMGYEGFEIARWLNQQGMAAFVLRYRVAPYHYPVEIEDGQRAMRYVRAHAASFGISPDRIGVWGFSAGGHLASSLGTHCGREQSAEGDPDPGRQRDSVDAVPCKPDFMVLSYPVISMQLGLTNLGTRVNLLGQKVDPVLEWEYSNEYAVTPQTPPTFLFATTNDPTVPVENSLEFYRALERAHVPAELHLYDYANHGCGLCGDIPSVSSWPLLLRNWLIKHGWLSTSAPPLPAPARNGPAVPTGFENGRP
jgi:acetyl esterase/lipase